MARNDEQEGKRFLSITAQKLGVSKPVKCSPDLSKCSDNGPLDNTNQEIKENSDSFHDEKVPNNALIVMDHASIHAQTSKCSSQQMDGVAISADNLQSIQVAKKENIQNANETNEDEAWNDALHDECSSVSFKKRLRGKRNSQICPGEVKRVTRSVTRNLKNNCTQGGVVAIVQSPLKRTRINEPSEDQVGSADIVTSVSDGSSPIDVATSSDILVSVSTSVSAMSTFSQNLKQQGKPNNCVHLTDDNLSRQGSSFQHSVSLSSSSGPETTAVFVTCSQDLASGLIENGVTVSSISMDHTLSGNSIRNTTSSHLENGSKFMYGEANFEKGFCDRSLQVGICENAQTSDKSKVLDGSHSCVKSSYTTFLPVQSVSAEVDFEAEANLFSSYPASYANISAQNYSGVNHRPSKAITEQASHLASHTPVLLPPVEASNTIRTTMANYSNSPIIRTADHSVRFPGTNNQFDIHSQRNDQHSANTIGSQDRIKMTVNQCSEIDRNGYYANIYEHSHTNKHFPASKPSNFMNQCHTNDRSLIHKEPSKPILNTLQSNNSLELHYVMDHSQKGALTNSLNHSGQTLDIVQSGIRIPSLDLANDITIDSLKSESSTSTHPHGTTQRVSYQSQASRCMLNTLANTSVSVDNHVHRQAQSQTLANSYSQSSNALTENKNNSYVSALPAVDPIKESTETRTPLLVNGTSNGKHLHCADNQNQASINCEQSFKQSSSTSPNRQHFKQSNNNTTFSSVAPYCPTSEACSQTSFPLQSTNFTQVHNQDVVSQLANTSKSHPSNQIQLQTVDHRQVLNYSNQNESAGKQTQKLVDTRIETLNSKTSQMGGSAVCSNTYSMEASLTHAQRHSLKTYSEQTCQLNPNQALYSNVNNYNLRQPSTKNQIEAHTAMKTQLHGQSQHMGIAQMYSELPSQDAIPMRHYTHVHSQIPYHNVPNNYSAMHDHISIHDHCSNGLLQSAAPIQNYEPNALHNQNLNRGLAHTDNRNCSNNYTNLLHNNSLTHRAIGPGQTDHSLASGNILNHPSRPLVQATEYHQSHGPRNTASMHTNLEQQQHHVMVHGSSVLPLAQSSVTPGVMQQPSSTHHTNVVNLSDVNLITPVTVGYNVHLSNSVLHAGTSQQCLRQPYNMQAMNHARQQGVQRHSKAVHATSYNHATAMSHHHNMVGMQQQQQHTSGSASVNFNASVHMNRQAHNQGRVRHCELGGLSGNIGSLCNTQLPNQSLQVHGQIEYVGAPVHHSEVNGMVQQQTNLHSHSNNALPAHMVYQDISAHNGNNSMNAQYHHSVGGQLYVPPSYNDLQCMHSGPLQQYAQYQRSKHHSQAQSLSEYVTQSCDMHAHQICYPDLSANSYHGNMQSQVTSDKINVSYGPEEQFVPIKRELMVGGDMNVSSQQHQIINKSQDVRYPHNSYQRNQMSVKHTQVQSSTNAPHSSGTDATHPEALDVETKHVSSNTPLSKLSLETICLPENASVVLNDSTKPATSLSDDLQFKDSLIHGITRSSVAESKKGETVNSTLFVSSSNHIIPTLSISALNNVKSVDSDKLTLEVSSVHSLASMHAEKYACCNDTEQISQGNEHRSSQEESASVNRQSINSTTPESASEGDRSADTLPSSETVTLITSENAMASQNDSSLIRHPRQDSPVIMLTSTENALVDDCQRDNTFLEPGSDKFAKCSAAANHVQEEGTRPPSYDVDSSAISVGPSSNISINNKAAGDMDIDIEECDCTDDHLLELNTEPSSPLPIVSNQGLVLISTISRESQEQHAPNSILQSVESSVDPIQSAAESSKNDGAESDSSDHPSKSTSPSLVDPIAEGAPTSPFPAFDRPSTPPEMLRNVQEATEYHKPTLLMRNFKTKKHAKLQICRQCDQVFSTRHCLVRHIERIHKPNSDQFTCATCHKKLHSDGALARHMQQHKTYPCKLCGVSFMRRVAFKKHIEQHSRESLSCTYCNKELSSIQALIMHTNTHRKEKPQHVCSVCNKKFANNRNLTVHSRIHSGDKPHECPNCNRTFSVKSNMLAHQELCTGKCRFKCDVCDRSFPLQSVLKRHLAEHGGNYHHSCSVCKKGFSKASGLKAHMKVHQSVQDAQQAGTASGSLPRPKTLVPRKSKRVGGKSISGGVRGPVACPVCSKQLSRPELLPDHVARHANKKQHQCPDCPRVFYYKNSVRPHQRSAHLREKPHTCTVCRKNFCHKSALKVHAAVHTGQKPHQCDNCGKAFATKSNYKRHLRCHVTLNVEVVEP